MNQNELYRRARRHVRSLMGFYRHLAIYIILSVFFMTVDYLFTFGEWRLYLALLGWGIGLAFHALNVFTLGPIFSRDWEERKIKEFMDKEQDKNETET